MNNSVFLLFSDNTWFYCHRDQIDGFCRIHKWQDDGPRSVIIVPTASFTQVNLEDE